jgi:single-strand DNA-binding protein
MYETMMTVVGNLVESPKLRCTKNGHYVANFRLASTTRRYDREEGAWVDGGTLFVTVTCWRGLGQNVAQSLSKGQPVIVTGRYYQRDFVLNEQPRTSYELEAVAVGPDLNRGVTTFQRAQRAAVPPIEVDAQGVPEDTSSHYLDLDDERDATDAQAADAVSEIVVAGVDGAAGYALDPSTGELREFATVT